ncbi:hypothetical protein BKA80DRAFT_85731 [Phyllosticta citrichinensis]
MHSAAALHNDGRQPPANPTKSDRHYGFQRQWASADWPVRLSIRLHTVSMGQCTDVNREARLGNHFSVAWRMRSADQVRRTVGCGLSRLELAASDSLISRERTTGLSGVVVALGRRLDGSLCPKVTGLVLGCGSFCPTAWVRER